MSGFVESITTIVLRNVFWYVTQEKGKISRSVYNLKYLERTIERDLHLLESVPDLRNMWKSC